MLFASASISEEDLKKPSSSTELALLRGPVAKVIAENYPGFARRVGSSAAPA